MNEDKRCSDFIRDELTKPVLSFTVYGNAAPSGSKRHVGGGRIVDSSKRAAPWKTKVSEAAANAMVDSLWHEIGDQHTHSQMRRPLLDGPLSVKMTFYMPRPKGHYRQNVVGLAAGAVLGVRSSAPGIRPSAPAWPTTRPDVLKLARAVEDACTGIIWRDDAQIVTEFLVKRYGEPARVEVVVLEAH